VATRQAAALFLLFGCDGALQPPAGELRPASVHLLVPGKLGLVGNSSSGCSTGLGKAGADADVWCAFYRDAPGGGTDLWVLNVSRASVKTAPCDGTSPDCLRLTSNLWTGDPLLNVAHPGIHGFEGDTLFAYADASVSDPNAAYRGAIKGWRPGWSAARTLTSPQGYLCHGDRSAAAAHCLDNVVDTMTNYELDLRAGSLAGSAPGPLGMVGRIRLLGSKGQIMWGAGFSPDGAWFLHSSPADGEDVEVLRLSPTTDGGVGPAMELRRGASRWQVAPDGKKLYFLEGYNYSQSSPAGALTMADFPAPGGVQVLQSNVGVYAPLSGAGEPDRGLGLLQEVVKGDGTFRILRDRAQPAQVTTVEQGVSQFMLSPDLQFTLVSKPNDPSGAVTLVARNDGQGSCLMSEKRLIYSEAFSLDSSTIFWAQDSAAGFGDVSEGWYAPADRCTEGRRFSEDIAYLTPVGGGLVYAESSPDRRTMTLRYVPLRDGVLVEDETVVIQPGADVSVTRGGRRFVLFTVSQGEKPGLYAYGPMP
jgi:hypothetical protein